MKSKPLQFRNLLILALMLFVRTSIATPVDVNHPVYGYLRRLEIRGWITPGFLGTLPLAKSDIDRLLAEANSKAESLPQWEKNRLQGFLEQFGIDKKENAEYPPLAYQDENFAIQATADFQASVLLLDSIPKAQSFGFGVFSGTIEGAYKKHLQFISNAGLGQQRSLHPRFTENYDPQRGMPYNTDRTGKKGIPRKVSSLDFFRTVVGLEDRAFRLEIGSDWNQWGPGIWQHATLSQNPWFWVQDSLPASDSVGFTGGNGSRGYRLGYRSPGESAPMTQIRMNARFGKFNYTKVVAERTGLWSDSAAHLIAHRLEYRPWSFLGFGIEEMIVTAGRPLDWTYAIPLIPLKYAEHQLGDRDNSGIGLDLEALIGNRFRVFGELLLDDFSGYDLKFWGNKFAYSLGSEAIGLPFASSKVQMEYARVEPWVFTHLKQDAQVQHFGSLLGSSIPPNSHLLRTAWEEPAGFNLDLRLEYALMQRDLNSRGSSIFDFHSTALEGDRKTFLGGTVETRQVFLAGANYRWRRFVEIGIQVGYLSVENWKSQSGKNLKSPLASLETIVRY
jgi:hypothetical protein